MMQAGAGPYIRTPAPYRVPLPFLLRQPNEGVGHE